MIAFIKMLFQNLLGAWQQFSFAKVWQQLAHSREILFGSLFIILLGLALTVGIALWAGLPPSDLTRDPAAVTESHFYIGLLSNLGALAWMAAATIGLFTAFLLRSHAPEISRWMLFSGIFSLMLGLDDLFMLHEIVYKKYLHIPGEIIYSSYVLAGMLYFTYFLPKIMQHEYVYMVTSLGLFTLSLMVDELLPYSNTHAFYEDIFKYAGIVLWATFFYLAGSREIRKQMPDL